MLLIHNGLLLLLSLLNQNSCIGIKCPFPEKRDLKVMVARKYDIGEVEKFGNYKMSTYSNNIKVKLNSKTIVTAISLVLDFKWKKHHSIMSICATQANLNISILRINGGRVIKNPVKHNKELKSQHLQSEFKAQMASHHGHSLLYQNLSFTG